MNVEYIRGLAKTAAVEFVRVYGADKTELEEFGTVLSFEVLRDAQWGKVASSWRLFKDMLREEVEDLSPLDKSESV